MNGWIEPDMPILPDIRDRRQRNAVVPMHRAAQICDRSVCDNRVDAARRHKFVSKPNSSWMPEVKVDNAAKEKKFEQRAIIGML